MPELDFTVTGVEPATHGVTPLVLFRLRITNQPATVHINSILLRAQIQIQSPRRTYNAREKEKLVELFGRPFQWGHTLRNRPWTTAHAIVGAFAGSTTAELFVPCSFDLNLAAAKYCYALESGEVPLLFLFSGTVFYATAEGALQVEQISWSKESVYRMAASTWRDLMEAHYPNSGWLYLNRDTFEQLYAYKRSRGLATWDQTIEQLLLPAAEREQVPA